MDEGLKAKLRDLIAAVWDDICPPRTDCCSTCPAKKDAQAPEPAAGAEKDRDPAGKNFLLSLLTVALEGNNLPFVPWW